MKIIKYIFLLILLAAIAVTVFIATQDGKYDIKKERIINVPQSTLFNYINDYRNWENVGILTNNDTTAVYTHSDSTSGNGAHTRWKLSGTEGQVKTIKIVDNDSLIQKAVIHEQPSDITWGFKKVATGTKVSVRMKGELSFIDKANAVFKGGVTEKLESTLDKGLANLDQFLVHELKTFNIAHAGVVTKTGNYYIGQSATSGIANMYRKINEIVPKLLAFAKENKIVVTGTPFTIFKSYDKVANNTTFKVCIPIKDEIFTMQGSDVEGGQIQPYQAFKTTLTGDYSHIQKAWDAAHKTVAAQGLGENTAGQYIEVYSKNIQHTKRPSQWVTEIYIPVGPNTAAEQPADVPMPPVAAPAGTTAAGTPRTGTSTASGATATRTSGTTTRPAGTGTTTAKPAGNATTRPSTGTTRAASPAGTATSIPKPKPKPAQKPAGTTPAKPQNTLDEEFQ